MMLAFATTAFAYYGDSIASWSSSVCMYGFTCTESLYLDPGETWDHYACCPEYVRYDGATQYGVCCGYVKTTSGTRMSGNCCNSATEEDDVYIYLAADQHDELRVRIENFSYPGVHNMRSKGDNCAKYDW